MSSWAGSRPPLGGPSLRASRAPFSRKAAWLIADITRGKNPCDLLTYFYRPGLANEHTDPHLVASCTGRPSPAASDPPIAYENTFHATSTTLTGAA
ncbi:hypothetical protein ACWCXK_32860 [Streptomyces sp. NPDC001739]|uniref:hypothetical protein n=1 Tax=Streptomyces sp. NPDC001633 TaxID=3364595 RepID=UPI00369BE9AF